MARRTPQHARPRVRPRSRTGGVEGNARFTSSFAAVIFILLFVEGVTIVSIRSLLTPHIFIGVLLIPPILMKIASTTWRMMKYYAGNHEYRLKGPPAPLLRLLGPVLVVLTLVLLFSGVGLVVGAPVSSRPLLFTIHRASFVLWFGVMAIHVLGHAIDTARFAPRDWLAYTRRQVRGASARQWSLGASLVIGAIGAAIITPYAANWHVAFFG